MHTEDDLRATLSALEFEAPDPVGTLAGLDRLRRRRTARRRVTVTAAVVVITGVLAAGSLAAPKLLRTAPPATQVQARTPLEFRFAIDDMPGFTTGYLSVNPLTGQHASILQGTDKAHSYDLVVLDAGKYDPTQARTGEPVDVLGKAGFYRADMPCHCSGNPPVPALVWEYGPNAWAVLQNSTMMSPPAGVREGLIRIARAVRFDRTTPVRVPFRVGWLPEGLRLTSGANISFMGSDGVVIGLSSVNGAGPNLSLSIGRFTGRTITGDPETGTDPIQGNFVRIGLDPDRVGVSSGGGRDMPRFGIEELTRVARSITRAADCTDPSTWIPAVEALPAT